MLIMGRFSSIESAQHIFLNPCSPVPSECRAEREYLAYIRKTIKETSFVHVPSEAMKGMLLCFGASHQELSMMETGGIHATLKQDAPPMNHRKSEGLFSLLL